MKEEPKETSGREAVREEAAGPERRGLDRRRFLSGVAGAGLAGASLGSILPACAGSASVEAGAQIVDGDLQAMSRLSGLELTESERELMLPGVRELRESYERLRGVRLANDVAPALRFDPLMGRRPEPEGVRGELRADDRSPLPEIDPITADPAKPETIAFLSVAELGRLLRHGEMTSVQLTQLYLDRLKRYGPVLECVVTLTEDRALKQARKADEELRAGRDRGPLHGIPWGAKDLLAVRDYPTTWGATPFQEQRFEEDAAVVRRLDEAGAVLIAKLTLGALAWGDVWFGGQTRNPWNLEQGSSGSSAGSASATAAGLVAFSLGSETWGSIVSPATRCGASGLRPTFGRVSRQGAMALSWSMDKLGPICRTVEDCALVFAAIHGSGGRVDAATGDPSLMDLPFEWNARKEFRGLRLGYIPSLFEEGSAPDGETPEQAARRAESRIFDLRALETLKSLGIELQPMQLPELPTEALAFILNAEAAAAFDELTRSGRDDELVRQVRQAWPNAFRQARTIPAVEYIQANRVRSLLVRELDAALEAVDGYVAPSFGGNNLLLTNLTGHPAVVLPHGFREDGTPHSISFMGRLFEEEKILLLAHAFQRATDFHVRHPRLPDSRAAAAAPSA